jgi:hypothetical protein
MADLFRSAPEIARNPRASAIDLVRCRIRTSREAIIYIPYLLACCSGGSLSGRASDMLAAIDYGDSTSFVLIVATPANIESVSIRCNTRLDRSGDAADHFNCRRVG